MPSQGPSLDPLETLDEYYRLVKETILDFQNPVTGLLPASLYRGQFVTGKSCSDAWIRDNVYRYFCITVLRPEDPTQHPRGLGPHTEISGFSLSHPIFHAHRSPLT